MPYAILVLFFITAFISLYEEYLGKYKWIVVSILLTSLIIVAGTREVGSDPDSLNYEQYYLHYDDTTNEMDGTQNNVEWSFIFFSSILTKFTNDVHAIFLLYAFLAVVIKFIAFRKLSKFIFLPLVVYISYYYPIQECIQIRAGVMSGLFLLAIFQLSIGNKFKAIMFILMGAFFHISALSLLPLALLNNKPLSHKKRYKWAFLIPIGYIMYFIGVGVVFNLASNIPYVGFKLSAYQKAVELGIVIANIYPFSPTQLLTIIIYCILLRYYDTVLLYDKYFPVMMKVFSLGIFVYTGLSFIPVLADRISSLLNVINIILFTDIAYIFRQKWAGKVIILVFSIAYLGYSLYYTFEFKPIG